MGQDGTEINDKLRSVYVYGYTACHCMSKVVTASAWFRMYFYILSYLQFKEHCR